MKHIDGWMTQFRTYYTNKGKKAARMMKSIKRVTFQFENRPIPSADCNQKTQKIRLNLTNITTKPVYFTQ